MTLKIWIIVVLAIIVLAGGAFFIRLLLLASNSRKHHLFSASSVVDIAKGGLKSCPQSPNCYLITIDKGAADLAGIKDAVVAMGGEVMASQANYFHTVFTTRLFGYVDDLEVLVKGEEIQIRSASRVGYSDMGANQKRVEALIERIR